MTAFGQDELRRMREAPAATGAMGLLGYRLVEFSEGEVTFEWDATPAFAARSVPAVHGGLIAALLDSAMGTALLGVLEPDETYATADIRCTLIRGAPFETLRAIGRVIHRGGRAAFTEGEVVIAGSGRLIARGSATQLILPRRPAP